MREDGKVSVGWESDCGWIVGKPHTLVRSATLDACRYVTSRKRGTVMVCDVGFALTSGDGSFLVCAKMLDYSFPASPSEQINMLGPSRAGKSAEDYYHVFIPNQSS
jgi:hypothetical protein